jgi:carbamoyltransferase
MIQPVLGNDPIVCTPQDALACFLHTRMDLLVMGNRMVQWASDNPAK